MCGILCAQQSLKACLRLLQAPVPLGARDWGHASREAAEGIFWESWPKLPVVLENEAGRGGEGFFWTNLGIRHLYLVSWGPWAVFLGRWGFAVCQERAAGHVQHLAGGVSGLPFLQEFRIAGRSSEKGESLAQLWALGICLGGRSGLQGSPNARLCQHQMCFIWSVCHFPWLSGHIICSQFSPNSLLDCFLLPWILAQPLFCPVRQLWYFGMLL